MIIVDILVFLLPEVIVVLPLLAAISIISILVGFGLAVLVANAIIDHRTASG